MPLYEYECDACSHRFEVIRKFSDPPLEICPACGGHVHKLLSSPAIQFKGSGWYITDYARKSSPESSPKKDTSKDPSKTDGSSSGTSGDTSAKKD